MRTAEVVICGAGIAGISAAYHLTARHGLRDVVLVDDQPPLSVTSDKSTECYRNWWPGPGDTMIRFMNRSIDLLEELAAESGNLFVMNRRGYAYLTADPAQAAALERGAREVSALGAGELRIHRGGPDDPPFPAERAEELAPDLAGADLVLDRERILRRYPFLTPDTLALLHVRRCGWLSAQQLGMYLLEKAREHGLRFVKGRIEEVTVRGGRVEGVRLAPGSGEDAIATRRFVNAAGPLSPAVGRMSGVELPLFNELHGKVMFEDYLGLIPRDLPLMIWTDPVALAWSDEEREQLAQEPELRWLLDPLPAGVHFRPEGGRDSRWHLLLWTYHLEPMAPVFPPKFDPFYPEVVVRGLSRMVPALAEYLGPRMRRPYVDGGYYCKTKENRLLVGPTPVAGNYLLCGMSGYGIMASQAAAELLAAHVTGATLPDYASEFALSRYQDPAYLAKMEAMTSGQL
ncbi:MAG TPA: FAD-binding oxidoreductase [Thermoanaerobaculia bacterium]|jgi:glycine/D-amino acid oxidase-like deaminating enzyme|nr:FAD-binding oxidoreductase [Thermoanaerobaculia bacterium]